MYGILTQAIPNIFAWTFRFGFQEINKLQRRREDSEETSQELRLAREQLQNTVLLPGFIESLTCKLLCNKLA